LFVHLGKTFLILLIQIRPRHLEVFPMKFLYHFPGLFQPLRSFLGILILGASCPFYKVSEFLELLVYPSDLSHVYDYLTFNDSFNLPFHVAFDVLWLSWGLLSVGSVRDFIGFEYRQVKYWVDFPASWDIEFEHPIPFFL